MSVTAWVIGSSGLLGSALYRKLQEDGSELFTPTVRFSWTREELVIPEIASAVTSFSEAQAGRDAWEVYWAAGIGAMGSTAGELSTETRALNHLLTCIGVDNRLADKPGRVVLASSAGAIYAGSLDDVITEHSTPAPTTAYGLEKLHQENLMGSFAEESNSRTALIARLSTLYGVGQSRGKKQGLISYIARSILMNEVVRIYVPFDTIRDYIISDDAAEAIVQAVRNTEAGCRSATKIIASEQPTTIAEIISTFRKITRHPPKIATSASDLSKLYSHCIRFRSEVRIAPTPRTSLVIGVSRVLAAERLEAAKPKQTNCP